MSNKVSHLVLTLNSICGHRCRYCYMKEHRHTGISAREYFKQQIKKYVHPACNVELEGGEPTFYPYLSEMAKCAKQQKARNITLISNGVNLTLRALSERLIAAGVNRFLFSFDAPNDELADHICRDNAWRCGNGFTEQ